MFGKIEDLFNSDIITAPKRKVEYRDEYKRLLKTYLDENTKVIAEVPCLKNMAEIVHQQKDHTFYLQM